MAQEVAYAFITPHTIRKSRTGAVLTRLLGRVSASLVAAQMLAPDQNIVDKFAGRIRRGTTEQDELYRQLIRNYIRNNFGPDSDGHRHRTLLLVFYGENVRQEISDVVGHLDISNETGETVRDTFGDLARDPDGSVRYFEPAVICSERDEPADEDLKLWTDFARTQPPVLERTCTYTHPELVEQTLVLIKPDSWRQKSSRPGAIIDMFSRTGLRIIGCKRIRISVAQALQFYGPVKDVLRQKLAPGIAAKAKSMLEKEFDLVLPQSALDMLNEQIGIPVADNQFERIIEFMTGHRPSACPESEWHKDGAVRCLALVYEGENAVAKIRDVLGPTDPTKAPSGTVRREFGSDVMVNTAHASDSPENAKREMEILHMAESNLATVVEELMQGNAG